MTAAFAEREAAPHVHTAACVGCGAASESPLCDDCAEICERAAEHTVACRCNDCRVYARSIATGEVTP